MREQDIIMGIERETHRMLSDGTVSAAAQPAGLRPPRFTKDFAESQLEIVTEPHAEIRELLSELDGLTRTAAAAVSPELLWPFSMPPRLPPDGSIRIADLGTGDAAEAGMRYRRGLALRYGKPRQMICGVHLNVSFTDASAAEIQAAHPLREHELHPRAQDALYLRLARNLYGDLRHLILLTGASPTLGGLCEKGYGPAVSYRNSALGYAGREYRPYLDMTSLEAYAAGIRRGLSEESPRFRMPAAEHGDARLSTRVFQAEKEFYAPIRFKRQHPAGKSGVDALLERGIEYVELRFLDVDPFSPLGISEETLMLFRLFIIDGLRRASGRGSAAEIEAHLDAAEAAALLNPRETDGHTTGETAAATYHGALALTRVRLESLIPLAEEMDRGGAGNRDVLAGTIERTLHPGALPHARLLSILDGGDWTRLGMEMASGMRSAV